VLARVRSREHEALVRRGEIESGAGRLQIGSQPTELLLLRGRRHPLLELFQPLVRRRRIVADGVLAEQVQA
jgi:hypothetical protein